MTCDLNGRCVHERLDQVNAEPRSIYLRSVVEGVLAAVMMFATVSLVALLFPQVLEGDDLEFGWGFTLIAVSLVPLTEEFLFRYLPSILYARLPDFRYKLVSFALLTSAIFSYAHAFNEYYLVFPQFFLGLLLWRAMLRRGYLAAALLHGTYNATLLLPLAVASSLGF